MPLPAAGLLLGGSILTTLKYMLPFIIIELAKLIGFSLVTFTVTDAILDQGIQYIHDNLSSIASSTVDVIAKAGLLDCIEIILTGWVASLQIKVTMGAFQKMRLKVPAAS